MAFETPDVSSDWPTDPQFTASATVAVRIINPWPDRLYFITTSGVERPALDVVSADYVEPIEKDDLILAPGASIWCAFDKDVDPRPITLHIAEN